MIHNFDEWAADLFETSRLDELSGGVVAIEAAEFLSQRIFSDPKKREPLLPAIGGLPFALKSHIEEDLRSFQEHKISPFFVFHGLDVGKKYRLFQGSDEAARTNAEAWDLYDRHKAEDAVKTFGISSSVRAEEILRYFQVILFENNTRFQIAPYSAWAQLAYLERNARDQFCAVSGSSEILLYDVDKVITSWDFENSEFTWIKRQTCISDLGLLSPDVFVDACLLSGCALLPTLPQLDTTPNTRKQAKIRHAIEIMMGLGRSGISVCLHYQDDPQIRDMDYMDRFKRNRLAVRHHVVLTKEGKVEPMDAEHGPSDIHELVGQHLPDEIYFYLSKNVIGPRVLNWRTSGEIVELPPVDNGESEEYRNLVRERLTPLRSTTLTLLSYSLHRFYQHKDVTLRCWFDRSNQKIISMRELTDPRPVINTWNVKFEVFSKREKEFEGSGMLAFAIQSLKEGSFAAETLSSTPRDISRIKLLNSQEEICRNSLWRFLHLREYVDSKHNLSSWGEVLATAFSALNGRSELEEAVFLAIEMARLGLLNADPIFHYNGGPARGNELDRQCTLLVSRVACFGQLRHQQVGFTGPLNRNLLGYHSMISTVRSSLRDLIEVCLATLLLNGDADRDRDDFTKLGVSLPLLLSNNNALGVAVKSYLEELLMYQDSTSAEAKASVKTMAQEYWFPKCINVLEDITTAFKLWDAVYAGVKSSPKLFKDSKLWDAANEWLNDRR